MEHNQYYNRPIFKEFPQLSDRISFIKLGEFPTPVNEVELTECGTNKLFVKRDDISGRLYGGNKIRKLEFLLADAKTKGNKTVMTFGTAGSNHCLATAIYAKKENLNSISMLTPQNNSFYVRNNLLASAYYKADINYFQSGEELKLAEEKINEKYLLKEGKKPYKIPLGGSCAIGNLGFVNAAFELKEQINRGLLPEPDFIYIATGTLGSSAGLILGLKLAELKTKVISVRINREKRVNFTDMMQQIFDIYSIIFPDKIDNFNKYKFERDIHIEHAFFGEEYSLFTEDGMKAIEIFKNKTGLLLDGTYTGKTMAAVIYNLKYKHNDKTVLFWNTKSSINLDNVISKSSIKLLPQNLQDYFEKDVQFLDLKYKYLY